MKKKEGKKELRAYEVWSTTDGSKKERMEKASEEVGVTTITLYEWKRTFKWDKRESELRELERKESDKVLAKAKAKKLKESIESVDLIRKKARGYLDKDDVSFGGGGDASRVLIEAERYGDQALSTVKPSGESTKEGERVIVSVVKALAEKGITTETKIVEADVEALKELMSKKKKEDRDETTDNI